MNLFCFRKNSKERNPFIQERLKVLDTKFFPKTVVTLFFVETSIKEGGLSEEASSSHVLLIEHCEISVCSDLYVKRFADYDALRPVSNRLARPHVPDGVFLRKTL